MNARHRRFNERGRRVDLFMDANAADFPAGGKGGTLAASLKELLAEVSALDVARSASTRKRQQGTEGREQMRTDLRRMLKSVSDTAKAVAAERPDIKGVFKAAGKNNNDQSLVAAARSAADAAAPLAALFTEYGLAAAFFNDLRAKADALENYASLQAAGEGEGVDTNATLEDAFRRMDELIDRLEPVVVNKYPEDHPRFAAWRSARRVESAPRPKAEEDDAPTPPAPNA